MTTLGQLGMQSVTLTPRFIFGLNGQLSNNLHIVDEKKLLYVAGHNVIIYNIDEKSQHFIPGCEGTEGINAISVSQSGRYLAICERGIDRAQCMVYEITAHKQRKILPEADQEADFKCKEFLDVAFNPKNERYQLLTLCGDPDWCILLWRWDDSKILSRVNLNIEDPTLEGTFQLSFTTMNTDSYVTVTGPSCYRYYQMSKDGLEFDIKQKELVPEGPSVQHQLSSNYTCHVLIKESARTVVCTDAGEIILTDYEGKFLAFIQESPLDMCIYACFTAQHGLVIAGQDGYIWTYNAVNTDAHFQICREIPAIIDKNAPSASMDLTISSMVLSPNEDYLYYVTKGNQLERVPLSFEAPSPGQDLHMAREPVHSPFHPTAITGMDVCLRKQLIVTTSTRHIYIWNYATRTLELKYECSSSEEAVAVAFHPSGFHIVVAFTDKI